MSKEFEIPRPTLTLDPGLGEPEAPRTVAPVEPETQESADEKLLSEEEKKMVDDFAGQIDLKDTNMVLQYGAGAQKKMADFSQTTLDNVRTQDLGQVGDMITGVITELKGFDATEEKGLFGIFRKGAGKVQAMKLRYDKAEANIDRIVDALQKHQVQLMKDSAMLDKMYELNLAYYKELTMYILAGRKKLAEVRDGELRELTDRAAATGRAEDAQAARDLEDMCVRFEKKLYDLDLTRTIAMQTAPQIRLVQNNDTVMVQKIQTTIVNTIPLWKSQMVLALGIANSNAALKSQTAVTNMTNDLLRKNAELLHTSTVSTARESERGIADIETLRQTNQTLIKTLDEVMQIQQSGRQKRQEAEVELRRMESELKDKLLEIRQTDGVRS